MLTEKDYCDYDTCVALKELGYNDVTQFFFNKDEVRTPRTPLYEAQKWLREDKKIIIEVNFNLMYKGQLRFSWRVLYNLTQHKGTYYTFDAVKSKEDYDSFEEALWEGIKEAIKLLKEE